MDDIKKEQIKSDDEYYQLFLDGDNTGFEQLVMKYKDHLIYFIHRYIKNLDLAEDLAQDVFVEVLIHKERFKLSSSFKTYIFTIGHNKAVDYIRKYSRQILVEDLTTPKDAEVWKQEESQLERHILQQEEKQLLMKSIKCLKEDYQAAILMVDLEGMSYKEASSVLHKTIPQMKILIYRARKALKKVLEKEEYHL